MKRIADTELPPAPRLDVRDLRVVLALASAGTTARASSLLHLTQPAVSRALLATEEKLGVRLFERGARGLTLNAAGERLVGGANRLLLELVDLEHRARTPAAGPTRIRLVCECYTAYHWLPSALRVLRETAPELEVVLAVEHTSAPVRALEAGEVDVALLTTGAITRGGLVQERALFHDEVVFVVAASHPLAMRKALTRADLRAHTLISARTPPAETQWFLARVFGSSRPKIRQEQIPLTEAILDMTRAGQGVAVMSEWIASPHLGKGDLVAKRFTTPLHRPWRIAYRSEAREAALRLVPMLASSVPHVRLAG